MSFINCRYFMSVLSRNRFKCVLWLCMQYFVKLLGKMYDFLQNGLQYPHGQYAQLG